MEFEFKCVIVLCCFFLGCVNYEPGSIVWGGDEGDEDATACKKSGDVDHGDHVALSHERN